MKLYITAEQSSFCNYPINDKNSLFVGRSIGILSLCVKHKVPACFFKLPFEMNAVFKIHRYALDYPGSPGGKLENLRPEIVVRADLSIRA